MDRNYGKIKDQIGLKEAFDSSDSENNDSDMVFTKLRPNSPYKLKELLAREKAKNLNQSQLNSNNSSKLIGR